MEHGEDLVAALEREVSEEGNGEIAVGDIASVCSNLGRREAGVPEQVSLTFRCRWLRSEPRAGGECADTGRFPVWEALRLVTAPQQKDKLLDAMAGVAVAPRYRAFRSYPYARVPERKPG